MVGGLETEQRVEAGHLCTFSYRPRLTSLLVQAWSSKAMPLGTLKVLRWEERGDPKTSLAVYNAVYLGLSEPDLNALDVLVDPSLHHITENC